MTMDEGIKTRQQLFDEQADTEGTRAVPAPNTQTTVSTSSNQRQR